MARTLTSLNNPKSTLLIARSGRSINLEVRFADGTVKTATVTPADLKELKTASASTGVTVNGLTMACRSHTFKKSGKFGSRFSWPTRCVFMYFKGPGSDLTIHHRGKLSRATGIRF